MCYTIQGSIEYGSGNRVLLFAYICHSIGVDCRYNIYNYTKKSILMKVAPTDISRVKFDV